jgi:hypothetical protein
MSSVSVTLGKSQKLINNLDKSLKRFTKQAHWSNYNTINIASVSYRGQNSNHMYEELKTNRIKVEVDTDQYMAMLETLYTAKETLFAGNVTSGISKIINDVKRLRKEIEVWETIQGGNKSSIEWDTFTEDMAGCLYSTNVKNTELTGRVFELSVKVYSNDVISSKISYCVKKISELESKQDSLNHSYKISLVFDPVSAKLIGI